MLSPIASEHVNSSMGRQPVTARARRHHQQQGGGRGCLWLLPARRVASSDTQHIRHSRLLAISATHVHALGADKASFRAVLSHCQSICPKGPAGIKAWDFATASLHKMGRDQPQVRGRPHAQSADHCLHVIAQGRDFLLRIKTKHHLQKKKYLQKISSTSVLADWSGRPYRMPLASQEMRQRW